MKAYELLRGVVCSAGRADLCVSVPRVVEVRNHGGLQAAGGPKGGDGGETVFVLAAPQKLSSPLGPPAACKAPP
uniref:Uncharacterized protein n=1 Tax=Nymphaea colorata TaxID=210225 RepID=A0A5K0VCJ4_9MAGN